MPAMMDPEAPQHLEVDENGNTIYPPHYWVNGVLVDGNGVPVEDPDGEPLAVPDPLQADVRKRAAKEEEPPAPPPDDHEHE